MTNKNTEHKKEIALLPILDRRTLQEMIEDEQRSSDERTNKVVQEAKDFLEKLHNNNKKG